MKLVLSRKGFDSQYGGMPSPILPDGRLLPLPIPTRHDQRTLADVPYLGPEAPSMLLELSRGKHGLGTSVHMDPDLERTVGDHLPGWRPALGQTGAAQSHLHGKGMGAGDVFLFFGWFREAEQHKGRWRYVPRAPNLHVLFGWIEVGQVLPIVREREACITCLPWIADHPHVASPGHYTDPRNVLYVAACESKWVADSVGGGRFHRYDDALRLTAANSTRSRWSLPAWFMPSADRPALSYHGNPGLWSPEGDRIRLNSAAKGQEFVLDMAHYPEAEPWLSDLIQRHGGS